MSDEVPTADEPPARPPRFLPFSEAREYVRGLGLKSQREWQAFARSDRRPANIPAGPENVYPEWAGLRDWLGTEKAPTKSFEEVRDYVRTLGVKTHTEWQNHVASGQLPPGIPRNPQDAFRGKGFTTWAEFLGRVDFDFLPFAEARAVARGWKIKSRMEWRERARRPDFPENMAKSPADFYAGRGWVSWDDWLGNEGRWPRPIIKSFLESLLGVARDLTQAELLVILKRKGLLGVDFHANAQRDILTDLARLCEAADPAAVVQGLADKLDGQQVPEEPAVATNPVADPAGAGRGEVDVAVASAETPDNTHAEVKTPTNPDVVGVVADVVYDDQDVLDFLIENRVAGLWQRVLGGDPTFSVEEFRTRTGDRHATLIRDRFLAEYDGAMTLPVPPTYAYQKDGRPAPPLPMQRLIAYRVLHQKRVGNWSGVGAGKTVSAILSALAVEARLTLVLAFNSTLDMWAAEIKAVCPTAQVAVKSRGPYRFPGDGPAFVVMNYESFQTDWAEAEFVPRVTAAERPLAFVIVDEIQSVRQRAKAEESARRRGVRTLLAEARRRNLDLRVLAMSATPVINDLHEARVTLEMLTGEDFGHLPTRFAVANAIAYHQQMIRHGLRLRPTYPVQVTESVVTVDGSPVVGELKALGRVRLGTIHALERVLLKAKLAEIERLLRPGTLVYTEFVEGFVDELVDAARRRGLTAGLYTGDDKFGLDRFRNRLRTDLPAGDRCEVLIGSRPVGTGINGLQEVSDRLVFASLPWTAAEYEQVVGRLKRHGSRFPRVEVFVPQVELNSEWGTWSWDRYRLQCIRFKRSLADAVIDGVVPEGRLPTQDEMHRESVAALQEWITRVDGG